jgi:GT2 family glycosyltransferase
MKQNVICVAGAHRSGTSMLTRLLYHCGLDLGPQSEMMPAAADNPDGFWEHLRFVALNDELLNAVGAAWDLPPSENESFAGEALHPLRQKAQLLIDEFREKPTWGWKDPRNSLTIRFWESLLPGLRTVVIVRNPLEVAYSMNKRNGVSYALGLRLWEIYNRRLLSATTSAMRIVVHYQSFFEEPDTELERLVRFIGLTNEGVATAAALVSSKRRHTQFSLEEMIDAGVSESTIKLYQELLAGTMTPVTGEPELDKLKGARSRLHLHFAQAEETRKELATLRGTEIQLREEITRHQKVIEELRQELNNKSVKAAADLNLRDGRIEELQKAYAHLDELLVREQEQRNRLSAELQQVRAQLDLTRAELTREVERSQNELELLRDRFVQTNELLQKTSIRLTDVESQNNTLRERLRKQLSQMKRLLRLLDQVEDAATRLRRSRRWKMANPFSALVAAITHRPLAGFGHLDNTVEKYRTWRGTYYSPEELDQQLHELTPRQLHSSQAPVLPPAPLETEPAPIAPSQLKFETHAQPEVSIIIPVYNQSQFTLRCLSSIQQHSSNVTYEVVVVDDHSSDNTAELMRQVSGLTYLRAERNAGFVASCNRGAMSARGKYLLFLNNDTTVTPGWLDNLLATYSYEPKAGLVGSKLIYPDGRLQEAGGIIWRDGSGWNRGKYEDPSLPKYNYLREVDYCSAASVMIPKSLFEKVGRFDQKYSPAYYEDTDLAFKVAQSGYKVLYQPLSVVIHHEGATAGTDVSAGAKRYQEINRATFVSTWKDQLASRPSNGDIQAWEAPPPGRQRILVIDHDSLPRRS